MLEEVSSLQEQAKFLHESCQLEEALPLFDQLYLALKQSGHISSEFLDEYAELCVSLGDVQKSKKIYEESMSLFPEVSPQKYFSYAQLCCGEESVGFYMKGISISTEQDKSQLASAYSALAEIYMTDLW